MNMPWDMPPKSMRAPWDVPDDIPGFLVPVPSVRPELIKDPITGLYPGQMDADDIPGFLRRVREGASQ
jgi:hypothetical protein